MPYGPGINFETGPGTVRAERYCINHNFHSWTRILPGAACAAVLLLNSGLFLRDAAAATRTTLTTQKSASTGGISATTTAQGLALSWQASPSSPDIDGYRVYYGTSSENYSQHLDVIGTGTSATVSKAPSGRCAGGNSFCWTKPRLAAP